MVRTGPDCVLTLNTTRNIIAVAALLCLTFPPLIPQRVDAQQADAAGKVAVTVDSGDIVKAGETVTFIITVDRPPNFEGGQLLYWIKAPSGWTSQSGVVLEANKRAYRLEFVIPTVAEGGV